MHVLVYVVYPANRKTDITDQKEIYNIEGLTG